MGTAKSLKTESDVRQLQLMKSQLVSLLERKISLDKFIRDQWALIEMLESVDAKWTELYLAGINSIEEIRSGLGEAETSLSKADESAIDEIAERLLGTFTADVVSN